MRKTIIWDVDGTLANCTHRLHHVKHGHRNWDAFFAEMGNDTPNMAVRDLLLAIQDYNDEIAHVICSGRPENYRDMTESWLYNVADVYWDAFYMRPADDTRADYIIKKELLAKMREDGYEPFLVIDDRQSVVDMWRAEGLTCLQCAPDRPDVPETARLDLMCGPAGAGKTTWLNGDSPFAELRGVTAGSFGIHPSQVLNTDQIRHELCGDFRDQSKNDEAFEAVHAITKTRLTHGLPTVIDATNLRRKNRLDFVHLVPEIPVRYFVIDRPIDEKRATGGWRNELTHIDLIGKHDMAFQSQIKDILKGDNQPNVTVHDLRGKI